MSASAALGSVASLFPHVKNDWWSTVFDEFYLRTDGDVVDDYKVTEAECREILRQPHVNQLFSPRSEGKHQDPIKVLDLCCGQGRHSVSLAERYPNIQFRGHDGSSYLINLAIERAAKLPNVRFSEAKAGPILDGPFDLVLLLGNSFGYGDQAGDVEMLNHIFKAMKPGAFFVMDIADAEWLQSTIKDRSWEWIDGRSADELVAVPGCAKDMLGTKLLACRERELSAKKDTLACREMIIDVAKGVIKDNFYSVRLYKRGELDHLCTQCGFAVHPERALVKPQSRRDQDLGMMGRRHQILTQNPKFGTKQLPFDDADVYFVHPSLKVSVGPERGRRVLATTDITAGTLLFACKPYSMVPSIDLCRGDYFICSHYRCSKRMKKSTAVVVTCVCIQDVVWCDADCRAQDAERHQLECTWLQTFAHEIISKYGTYDFNMLWINVRVLCQRQVELKHASAEDNQTHVAAASVENELHAPGAVSWDSVGALLANQDRFPAATLTHWSQLAHAYLQDQPFASGLAARDLERLICQEETNSFGMYPKATGRHPRPEGPQGRRGIAYGLALHTRGSFFNHSCLPNVMHGPDRVSRMVMHATQAIAAGEECCIAYFDLAETSSLAARRELLMRFFNFTCDCQRCKWEADLEQT